jgi:DNA-binding PadR family transcriptional regulator
MSDLARLFGPHCRPSPGSVYPAVEALQGEGLIDGETQNGRTTYRTTAAGSEALVARSDALAAVEVRTGARLLPLSGRVDPEAAAAVLDRAAAEIESLDTLATEETRR